MTAVFLQLSFPRFPQKNITLANLLGTMNRWMNCTLTDHPRIRNLTHRFGTRRNPTERKMRGRIHSEGNGKVVAVVVRDDVGCERWKMSREAIHARRAILCAGEDALPTWHNDWLGRLQQLS